MPPGEEERDGFSHDGHHDAERATDGRGVRARRSDVPRARTIARRDWHLDARYWLGATHSPRDRARVLARALLSRSTELGGDAEDAPPALDHTLDPRAPRCRVPHVHRRTPLSPLPGRQRRAL